MADENSMVTGVAWQYDGIPSIRELDEFLKRENAVLRVVLKDEKVLAELPLVEIPCFFGGVENWEYCTFYPGVRTCDIVRWETPKEVGSLAVKFDDGEVRFLDKSLLESMRPNVV